MSPFFFFGGQNIKLYWKYIGGPWLVTACENRFLLAVILLGPLAKLWLFVQEVLEESHLWKSIFTGGPLKQPSWEISGEQVQYHKTLILLPLSHCTGISLSFHFPTHPSLSLSISHISLKVEGLTQGLPYPFGGGYPPCPPPRRGKEVTTENRVNVIFGVFAVTMWFVAVTAIFAENMKKQKC